MATVCQLGTYDGTTFTLKFDLNDATTTFIGPNPQFGSPEVRTGLIENFASPGSLLSASQWGLRTITIPFRLTRTTTDLMLSSWSSLLQALDPQSFPPPSGSWAALRFAPNGASGANTRYYSYFRSAQPTLYDGTELTLYRVATLHAMEGLIVTLTAQPFAYGANTTI